MRIDSACDRGPRQAARVLARATFRLEFGSRRPAGHRIV